MNTVSTTREEKNLEDAKLDFQAGQLIKRNNERILYLQNKIKEEKVAIIDCLDQNFFSMAKTKIERIETITNQINELRNPQS